MTGHFVCPQGHHFEAPLDELSASAELPVVCPVCGAAVHFEPIPLPRPAPTAIARIATADTAQFDQASAEPAWPQIAGYEILGELGRGGMGAVYKARHLHLERTVALKVLSLDRVGHPNALQRFHQEARAAARLLHPHIVTVYEAGESGGTPYIAMEFVDGTDLAHLVAMRGPLPAAHACSYVRQAALGLQHAHLRGLVHRDVKPANLLVTAEGVVKVLDLGLARLQRLPENHASSNQLTRDGWIMGTPDFMAPEQAMDCHSVDIRADVYSLGCTLYFLLAGHPPFPGGTPLQQLLWHQQAEPRALEESCSGLPHGLPAIVRRMMARRPEDRYQTAAETAKILEPFCVASHPTVTWQSSTVHAPDQPIGDLATKLGAEATAVTAASPVTALPSTSARPKPLLRRTGRRRIMALVAGVVLVLAILLVWLAIPDRFPQRFTNNLGMKFVLVPAGSFMMGSDLGVSPYDTEAPKHLVHIPEPFYISDEVTVGQFAVFVREKSYITSAEKGGAGADRHSGEYDYALDANCTWKSPGFEQTDEHPVVCVTWNDAVAFCLWLSEKEGKTCRLPTEELWEYACRGGSTHLFAFGPTLSNSQANIRASLGVPSIPPKNRTTPIRSYPPNEFGLYDMHGNVWEWCLDEHRLYPGSNPPPDLPRPNKNKVWRNIRGGSWNDSGWHCRSANRAAYEEDTRTDIFGFRVVYIPSQEE